jgi:hypothetical protein
VQLFTTVVALPEDEVQPGNGITLSDTAEFVRNLSTVPSHVRAAEEHAESTAVVEDESMQDVAMEDESMVDADSIQDHALEDASVSLDYLCFISDQGNYRRAFGGIEHGIGFGAVEATRRD